MFFLWLLSTENNLLRISSRLYDFFFLFSPHAEVYCRTENKLHHLKSLSSTYFQDRNRLTDFESKLMVTKRGNVVGRNKLGVWY